MGKKGSVTGRPVGGNAAEGAKILSGKQRIIDPDAKPKKIVPQETDGSYKCSCCGKVYKKQMGNFPVSNSILFAGNNHYATICRSCLDKYYSQLVDFYSGNEEHAVEHCCWMLDCYYNTDAYAMTFGKSTGGSRICNYLSKVNMNQIKTKGTTYIDTLKERYSNKIMTLDHLEETDEDGVKVAHASKETVMFFGFGYTDEEYEYLENQYTDWTTRYECKTKAQEELFKSLCIAQLTIQKAQRGGSTKEISDAMKTFQDLLGTANLKPSQSNDNALADQNTFGTLIRKWENERPISKPEPEWEDVDGIKKMIDTFFLGHLCNLVHVQNDKEAEYRAEMAKYTVTPPVYETDGEAAEVNILDKYSDKGDKS